MQSNNHAFSVLVLYVLRWIYATASVYPS
jgi:hypothetical protein